MANNFHLMNIMNTEQLNHRFGNRTVCDRAERHMLRHRLNLDFFPPERLAFFGPLASASTAFPFSFAGFGLASLGFSAVALPPMRLSVRMDVCKVPRNTISTKAT